MWVSIYTDTFNTQFDALNAVFPNMGIQLRVLSNYIFRLRDITDENDTLVLL